MFVAYELMSTLCKHIISHVACTDTVHIHVTYYLYDMIDMIDMIY